MKNKILQLLITGFIALAAHTVMQAQTVPVLYGLTTTGGGHNVGTIFKYYQGISVTNMDVFDFDTSTTVAGAANFPGGIPYGSLILASDGNLYGLTQFGGANGFGTIFSFNPGTNVFTKKFDLTDSSGTNPTSSFMQASDGNLYATTSLGGANNMGTVIKYNYNSNTITKLHDFSGNPDGQYPQASFTEDDSVLYSTTMQGGTGPGTIFQYDLRTGVTAVDVNFDNSNLGRTPYGGLTLCTDGKMYGASSNNAGSSWGVLYSFNPATTSCIGLYSFPETNTIGGDVYNNLLQAHNGLLYGLTYNYSDIFEYDPSTVIATNVFTFTGVSDNDGYNPYGGLIQASDSLLYGMTSAGGANSTGVLFNYNIATTVFNPLVQLSSITGDVPWGNLLQVGTTNLSGINDVSTNSLSVFPNPAHDQITVQGIQFNDGATITVTDVSGKIISENTVGATSKATINVQSLAAGMYLIQVSQQGELYTAKFAKTN